tara:strand:+ start:2905 stop:3135 length:231 start_codon:yes stop_codon:yes gene_type:complete
MSAPPSFNAFFAQRGDLILSNSIAGPRWGLVLEHNDKTFSVCWFTSGFRKLTYKQYFSTNLATFAIKQQQGGQKCL